MEYDYTYEMIEKLLLKRCLTEKRYLSKMCEIFDERWFSDNKNIGTLMKIAISYYKKYQSIPSNGILQACVKKFAEKSNTDNVEELNASLLEVNNLNIPVDDECATKNIDRFKDEKGFYYSVSDNINELVKHGNIDKCLERFYKVQKTSFKDDDNLGHMFFDDDAMERHWLTIKNPDAKLPTLWSGLDYQTNGGFLRDGRMLSLFVAQPGLGKSLFLSNLAVNILKQDKTVVVISLEMSEDVYSTRFDSIISGDNINGLRNSYEHSIKMLKEFKNKHPNAGLIVKEYPPSSIRVIDIENYLEKLVAKGIHIDAIVIDYLNLVLPNTNQDTMYMSIKRVSEQLRALSYKFHAPVFSATQSNRSGMNNDKIDLENISESNGQAATADFIGMLYQLGNDREAGIINMRIAKNRFGSPGKSISFRIDSKSLQVIDQSFDSESDLSETESERVTNNISNISADLTDADF